MQIPPLLLVADVVGAFLLGLGAAEHFVGTNIVPGSLQFHNYDIAMIVTGAALMMPMLAHVVKNARSRQ